MKTVKYEGILTALTPIHHGGDEKTGAVSMLRRMTWIVDDEPLEVPYIEGNAIRGMLRRLVMQDLIESVEWKPKNTRIYHTMFSGGVLEELSTQRTGTIDLKLRRDIRTWLPPLSLWGGSLGNQAFQGKMIVGKALPICEELNDFLTMQSKISVHNYLQFIFFTRRHEREPDIEGDDEKKTKNDPVIQMKVEVEQFAPGTKFYHWFTLMDTTPIEDACFANAIALWKQRPYIGGRSNTGGGELRISYDIEADANIYREWLGENRDDVVRVLDRLDKL